MDISLRETFSPERLNAEIENLLLSGAAQTASDAENQYLDSHLEQLTRFVTELGNDEILDHEVVRLLLSHGSRPLEDFVW
jgi:hypothetical protein